MMNTAAFEIKLEAAHALHNIAFNCGKDFLPFVEKSLQTVVEVIGHKSKEFRETGLKILNSLIAACDTEDKMAVVFNTAIPSILKNQNKPIKVKMMKNVSSYYNNLQLTSNSSQLQ